MNKKEAIVLINSITNSNKLNTKNTHWSDIVKYGKDFGWWLNIPFHKFSVGFFMVLNDSENKNLIFLEIPPNQILNPESKFRNKENTADVFISYSDKQDLTDIQSYSTNFQFAEFVVKEIPWL